MFNDKYIFIFGGRKLHSNAKDIYDPHFDLSTTVEVLDIEKNMWSSINYISDNDLLKVVVPGVAQISSQRIMIFGGIIPNEDEEDHGYELTNKTIYINVSNG